MSTRTHATSGAITAVLPLPWPVLPPDVAARWCSLCSFAWRERDRAVVVKYVNRACPVHGRSLD